MSKAAQGHCSGLILMLVVPVQVPTARLDSRRGVRHAPNVRTALEAGPGGLWTERQKDSESCGEQICEHVD